MVVNRKNVIVVSGVQDLLVLLDGMLDHHSSCVEDQSVLISIIQVLPAVLTPEPLHVLEFYLNFGFIFCLLGVLESWFFDCTQPWLNCHELVSLVFYFIKLLHLSCFFLLPEGFVGQINVFI